MAGPALFDSADLTNALGRPVDGSRATLAERVVWGWLVGPLGLADDAVRPAQASPRLFSWAVELGVIAYFNMLGLDSYQLGAERLGFKSAAEATARRTAILAEVAAATAGSGGTAPGGPVGSFPPARAWPDPVCTGPGYGYPYYLS